MTGWEIALIIFAVTYMMVNTVSIIVSIKMLGKLDGLLTKSYKLMEKVIDKTDENIDKMFEDL